MTNPDGKYGRSEVRLHKIENFKDCVMAKLRFVPEIDFRTAVHPCIVYGKKIGLDLDKQQREFFKRFFDEIVILERLGKIEIHWEDFGGSPGKKRVKKIILTQEGAEWFRENDFEGM